MLNDAQEQQSSSAAYGPKIPQSVSETLCAGLCRLIEEVKSNVCFILTKTVYIFYFSNPALIERLYTQLQYRNYSSLKLLKGGAEISHNR
jgi:hypothetical protein